jgi:membrane protein YdbS with pleckstrin-like domain
LPTNVPPNIADETVIAHRLKHWINIAPVMVACLILFLALIVGLSLYPSYAEDVNKFIPASLIGLFTLVYSSLVALIALLSVWIYRNNRLLLTNHHIVEFTRRGVFDTTISQFSLGKLQDVSCQQRGILPNLLGYGDIHIETAGEQKENFIFTQVPQPQELASQIMQAHEDLGTSDAV